MNGILYKAKANPLSAPSVSSGLHGEDETRFQTFWGITLPETNSSHLEMDGWNTIVSFWDGQFSGAFAVSFREGKQTFLFIGEKISAKTYPGRSCSLMTHFTPLPTASKLTRVSFIDYNNLIPMLVCKYNHPEACTQNMLKFQVHFDFL